MRLVSFVCLRAWRCWVWVNEGVGWGPPPPPLQPPKPSHTPRGHTLTGGGPRGLESLTGNGGPLHLVNEAALENTLYRPIHSSLDAPLVFFCVGRRHSQRGTHDLGDGFQYNTHVNCHGGRSDDGFAVARTNYWHVPNPVSIFIRMAEQTPRRVKQGTMKSSVTRAGSMLAVPNAAAVIGYGSIYTPPISETRRRFKHLYHRNTFCCAPTIFDQFSSLYSFGTISDLTDRLVPQAALDRGCRGPCP